MTRSKSGAAFLCGLPEHGKMGGEEKKQKKALALSLRQGNHFNPQCGRLRGTKIKDLDIVLAEEYTVTTRLRTWYDLYAKPNIRH